MSPTKHETSKREQREEILRLLEDAITALTVRDLAKQTGYHESTVKRRLLELQFNCDVQYLPPMPASPSRWTLR